MHNACAPVHTGQRHKKHSTCISGKTGRQGRESTGSSAEPEQAHMSYQDTSPSNKHISRKFYTVIKVGITKACLRDLLYYSKKRRCPEYGDCLWPIKPPTSIAFVQTDLNVQFNFLQLIFFSNS